MHHGNMTHKNISFVPFRFTYNTLLQTNQVYILVTRRPLGLPQCSLGVGASYTALIIDSWGHGNINDSQGCGWSLHCWSSPESNQMCRNKSGKFLKLCLKIEIVWFSLRQIQINSELLFNNWAKFYSIEGCQKCHTKKEI